MSSPVQSSVPHDIIIDIPSELFESGKTLLIEKYAELFVDGCHLSKPSRFVRQVHGLCLLDSQQQDLRSVDNTHQLQSNNDDNQLVQIIIEFPTQSLNDGKSVTIATSDSSADQSVSGNVSELYNAKSSGKKNIDIQIGKACLQRGTTILIQQDNVSVRKSDDDRKQQSHHLINNHFAKRDHLQSKHLMEMTIEVPPELLINGQTITFRKEDPQAVAANFLYRRHSKVDISHDHTGKSPQRVSMEDFLSNKTWNPILADHGHLLQLTLDLSEQPDIHNDNQLKISHHGSCLRVESNDPLQGSKLYGEVLLPETVKFDQLKHQFDKQHHRLQITLPLH